MIEHILRSVAPHHCYGCGILGASLCSDCKYDIVSEPYEGCVSCEKLSSKNGVCKGCRLPYSKAWVVAERSDALEKLLDGYKFYRQKDNYKMLASLLASRLPDLPPDTIITTVPTLSSHIRQRGYDHMRLVAKEVAKQKTVTYVPLLSRKTKTKQLGASRNLRLEQAKMAFVCNKSIQADSPILLIDDVFTTGATVRYCTEALRAASASEVWLGIIARQPLDKTS